MNSERSLPLSLTAFKSVLGHVIVDVQLIYTNEEKNFTIKNDDKWGVYVYVIIIIIIIINNISMPNTGKTTVHKKT